MTRTCLLLAVLLIAPFLTACGAGGPLGGTVGKPGGTPAGESMTAGERNLALRVLDLLNQERSAASLPPLEWDETAADVAYDHCVDMHLRGYVSHYNPEGLDGFRRLLAAGVDLISSGENIAQGHQSPAGVMAAWMSSPGHVAPILNPGFTRVGIGVHTGTGGPWWTQDFVAPPVSRQERQERQER